MILHTHSYWKTVRQQFYKHKLGVLALYLVGLFVLVGVYAPFLASSKPLIVNYGDEWFFPLFRYLFYRGFYTKRLDIFFNILMFTLPLTIVETYLCRYHPRWRYLCLMAGVLLQAGFFLFFAYGSPRDPAFNANLSQEKQSAMKSHPLPNWTRELTYMTPYAKLNLVLHYQQEVQQQQRLEQYRSFFPITNSFSTMPTLWQRSTNNEEREIQRQNERMAYSTPGSAEYKEAEATRNYIVDRRQWLEQQLPLLRYEVMPLIRPFHWEEDAGGSQQLNLEVPFWELTRTNRKDLVSALIFGVRISLVVGILAVSLALAIGLPIGAFAGYYGGTFDIIVSRLLEIWEAMPTFFMMLMIVAIMQSKSIFLVIMIIGVFGWTSFSRYLRGEFFKQRNLPYIEACRAMGFHDSYIIFSHILPNAIPPVLTLLPFAIMGAITSEAGLSFLGLGEEGSCSWGVLMDEGRAAFPSEAYLLWPPAILLTVLLVAIALVGDAMRDTLDPKMHRA